MPGEGEGGDPPPVTPVRVSTVAPRAREPVQDRLTYQTAARELVRAALALAALALLFVTVILGYLATTGGRWANAKEWLQVVLPAETAILGSALGFYFGTHQSDQSGSRRR